VHVLLHVLTPVNDTLKNYYIIYSDSGIAHL